MIFLLSFSKVFSFNPSALDNFSEAINEMIWTNRSISNELVQNNLYFLNDDDTDLIKENTVFRLDEIENKLKEDNDFNPDSGIFNFLNSCKEIFELYSDFYEVPQAAVQILFDRVLVKYNSHALSLKKEKALLSSLIKSNNTHSLKRENRSRDEDEPLYKRLKSRVSHDSTSSVTLAH